MVPLLLDDVRPAASADATWRQRMREVAGSAGENPAVGPGSHCITVRMASRPGSDIRSAMPISSPYRIIGVPGRENWSE